LTMCLIGLLVPHGAGRETNILDVSLVGAVIVHKSEMPSDRGARQLQVIKPRHQSPSTRVQPFSTDGGPTHEPRSRRHTAPSSSRTSPFTHSSVASTGAT